MSKQLEQLLDQTRNIQMTSQQREAQRRSFAYGNAHLENKHVTPEMIDAVADRMVNDSAKR
ncbi:MAG: hypothetical protein WBB01_24605 [Phormidesmis sp.]